MGRRLKIPTQPLTKQSTWILAFYFQFSHCRVRIWSHDLSIRMPLGPLLVNFIWFPAYSDWFRNWSLSWAGPIRSFSDFPACLSAGIGTLVVSTLSQQHLPFETDGAGRFLEHTYLKSAVLWISLLHDPMNSSFFPFYTRLSWVFVTYKVLILKAERNVLYISWRKY